MFGQIPSANLPELGSMLFWVYFSRDEICALIDGQIPDTILSRAKVALAAHDVQPARDANNYADTRPAETKPSRKRNRR